MVGEVAGLAGMLPQQQGEDFPSYKIRISIAQDRRNHGLPLPETVHQPLNSAAFAAYRNGVPVSTVLLTKPAAPKPVEPRKSRADVDSAKRRADATAVTPRPV